MENKTTLIERMIELGCDIHAKNKERYTTLHLSSMYSREDTIRLLLSKKGDPNLPGGVSSLERLIRFLVLNQYIIGKKLYFLFTT